MKKIPMVLFCCCLLPAIADAGVYKWVDDAGQVHYSDQPEQGAKPIELPKGSVYTPVPLSAPAAAAPKVKVVAGYRRIELVSPAPDAAIRSNAGQVSLALELEPKLQSGDQVVIYLDGARTGKPQAATVLVMQNVARGTHQVQVAVINAKGQELGRSNSVTFHLLRTMVPRIQ